MTVVVSNLISKTQTPPPTILNGSAMVGEDGALWAPGRDEERAALDVARVP